MKSSARIFKNKWTVQETEFAFIVSWMLLFPQREEWLFRLVFLPGFALAMSFFCLRRIIRLRNIADNTFSRFLSAACILVLLFAFLSPLTWRSLGFAADLLLVAIFFAWWESPLNHPRRYLQLLGGILSLSAAASLFYFLLHLKQQIHSLQYVSLFFNNPILQGIASGAGVILFLTLVLERFRILHLVLLLLNAAGLLLAGSKAAFLGTLLLSLYLLLLKKRSWVKFLLVFLLLAIIIPTPLQRRISPNALKKDPFVVNRIRIWKMTLRMFADRPLAGIGLEMFPETSRRYNFPQENDISRYGMIPESPHSDYLKVVVEMGAAGLAAMAAFLWLALALILRPPRADPAKLLLAYFLFQALFFNYIFQPFFLFSLFFLLKVLLEGRSIYFSPGRPLRVAFAATVAAILLLVNVFPAAADFWCWQALRTADPGRAFALFERAERFKPSSDEIPFWKGTIALEFFKARGNLEDAAAAIGFFRQAVRKNPFLVSACLAESEVYQVISARGRRYAGIAAETIEPLNRAERLDPYNPFLKFTKAVLHLRFGERAQAEACIRQALGLEPNYVSALYFLKSNFDEPRDEVFHEHIAAIKKRIGNRKFRKDSYLDKLYEFPAETEPAAGPLPYSMSASTRSSR